MDRTIASVRRRVEGRSRPRTLLFNRGGFTAGTGTLFDEQVRLAGGENAAADVGILGYGSISVEELLGVDPDVIFVVSYTADGRGRSLAYTKDFARDPTWRGLQAVRGGRVHALTSTLVLSTSQFAGAAVREMAELLHPEAAWEGS
jgi:iron complex transport system substrate-binding protein